MNRGQPNPLPGRADASDSDSEITDPESTPDSDGVGSDIGDAENLVLQYDFARHESLHLVWCPPYEEGGGPEGLRLAHALEHINTVDVSPALARSRRRRIRGIYKHYDVFDSFHEGGRRFLIYSLHPRSPTKGEVDVAKDATRAAGGAQVSPPVPAPVDSEKKNKGTGRRRGGRGKRRDGTPSAAEDSTASLVGSSHSQMSPVARGPGNNGQPRAAVDVDLARKIELRGVLMALNLTLSETRVS